jgi:hypothetical protein
VPWWTASVGRWPPTRAAATGDRGADAVRRLALNGKVEFEACATALHREFDRVQMLDPMVDVIPDVPRRKLELHSMGYRPFRLDDSPAAPASKR